MAEMKEYMVRGRVTLAGVWFFIKADSLEDAKKMAAHGDYDDYDSSGAETVDWEMEPSTCKEN